MSLCHERDSDFQHVSNPTPRGVNSCFVCVNYPEFNCHFSVKIGTRFNCLISSLENVRLYMCAHISEFRRRLVVIPFTEVSFIFPVLSYLPFKCFWCGSSEYQLDSSSATDNQQEPLSRAEEELLGAPVEEEEGAESPPPPVGQSLQMEQETTRSAATAGQGSSVAAHDSASVRQNQVLNGAPESDPPATRRRGRSAGWSSVSSSAPGTTFHLRSRLAAMSTNSRPHENLEGLDSSPRVDASTEEATDDCLTSEPETENPADMDVKSTAVMMQTENCKAIENSGDGYQRSEEDISLKRRSAVKSEKIQRKKRRMMDQGEF